MDITAKDIEHEFKGQPFKPSDFFWKTQHYEMEKVVQTCRVLNTLTPEQIKAVKEWADDRCISEAWDNHAE